MKTRPGWWQGPLLVILIVSALLRLGVALYLGDRVEEIRGGTADQVSYDLLAQRVATGHGFSFDRDWWPLTRANQPTAFWSYLYTSFLAAVYWLFGHHPLAARLIQALIVGFFMPLLVFRIGRRVFAPRVGLIAAAIVAAYFYFVHYAASLMTESLYITAILWTIDAALRLAAQLRGPHPDDGARSPARGRVFCSLELGLAMASALLFRQVISAFLVIVVLWLLWVGWRNRAWKQAFASACLAGAVVALLLVPWIVRNYRVFGEFVLLNTNVGINFFWSNHPIYGTRFEPVLSPDHGITYQELIPPELRQLNEPALDRALLALGLGFIRQDPGRYLLLSLSRIPVYFLFWPTPESTLLSNAARVLSFGVCLPFMIAGLYLAIRDLRVAGRSGAADETGRSMPVLCLEPVVLLLLFALTYTGIHLASWANVRYRLPVDAVLILFAGYAFDRLWDSLSGRMSAHRARSSHSTQGPS